MALQLGAMRDALRQAGASDELARAAAEEVAAYENRLVGIERQLVELTARLVALEARMTAVQWAIGFVAAMQIAIFAKLFVH